MHDPLAQFQKTYAYDAGMILAFSHGEKYVALMLRNGQIGVCATLGEHISLDPMTLSAPDLSKIDHRIVYNAFVNASANYTEPELPNVDIFENEDFSKKAPIVMVGNFAPLVQKFHQKEIPIKVFDRIKQDKFLEPIGNLEEELQKAEVVILTATSLFNGTILDVIEKTSPEVRIHLLGPSTPLDPLLFSYPGIQSLYGMNFELYDFDLLKIIHEGAGTRTFGSRGKKRYLCST